MAVVVAAVARSVGTVEGLACVTCCSVVGVGFWRTRGVEMRMEERFVGLTLLSRAVPWDMVEGMEESDRCRWSTPVMATGIGGVVAGLSS